MLSSEEQFKISTYLVVVNSIVSDLSCRIKAYSKVEEMFAFLHNPVTACKTSEQCGKNWLF